MKEIVINENNLGKEEIESIDEKVRCLIFNNKGQILIAKYARFIYVTRWFYRRR